MSVHDKIRQLVSAAGGRLAADRVVKEALGLAGANPALARKLLEATLREMRGLEIEGSDVVERATPLGPRRVALALAPSASSTALPPTVAWIEVPAPKSGPVVISLAGEAWRDGIIGLARDLAGAEVHALSAASARRLLRLGSRLADLDVDDESPVISLGQVSRALGRPLRSADDAAALVGGSAPEDPGQAAVMLGRLVEKLTEVLAASHVGKLALGPRTSHILHVGPSLVGAKQVRDACGERDRIGPVDQRRRVPH